MLDAWEWRLVGLAGPLLAALVERLMWRRRWRNLGHL
jgi:hypothetical protein